ncbi:alpha/beta hydrolase, partial [Arthrospira platensis SPKY1]|nr:alpha/beta hydrolase [Arthrospira platensis SPKY1]
EKREAFRRQVIQFFWAVPEYDLIQTRQLHRLYEIGVPVEIAWAKDDPVLPFRYSAEAVNHFRLGNIHLLQSGGHNLLKTRPEQLAKLLLNGL